MKLKRVLSYAVLIIFLAWCVIAFRSDIAKIDLSEIWGAWDALFLAMILTLFNYLFRILRWTYYLSKLDHHIKFRLSALTYLSGFAFTLSPGKAGEMVRGRYLQKIGVPFSNTAAAFFVERFLDLLVMVGLASFATVSSSYETLIWLAAGFIAIILVVLTLAPWIKITEWVNITTWLPNGLKTLCLKLLRTLISARVLLGPKVLLFGFLLGLIAWSFEGVGLMVISKMSGGLTMDVVTAVGIYSVAVFVGAVSFLPGGLGSTEAVMIALLVGQNYSLPDAILITLVCRVLTLWLGVVIGWGAVVALRQKKSTEMKNTSEQIQLMPHQNLELPLCIDLDGTLILSDLLLETFLLLIKRNPLYIFMMPMWLSKGKATLKAEIAKRVTLNPVALPYNRIFLDWLIAQQSAGRELWLCTASNYRLAQLVAEHLQIFTGTFASSDLNNLSGHAKAKQLTDKFGIKGFDYCGNADVDKFIWRESQHAILVNCSEKLAGEVAEITEISGIFPRQGSRLKSVIKAMRPHQWAKNLLVFIPLAAAHKITDVTYLVQALLAFFAFGFCASSVYLLNDMLDLEADRLHPRKCRRPFASGKLSILAGFLLVPLLLLTTILISSQLPVMFWIVLAGYYLLTLAYSFWLKSLVLVDTITLAGLYTARIIAGSMALDLTLSFWLLLFSVFLFYSLALVKRYAEMDSMLRQNKLKAAGRGYHIDDLPILHSLGTASGNLCVLVLALYINSPAVLPLYRYPEAIWFLCVLLLYWISRIWLKTHRGKMHDDPVIFAIKDKISLAVVLAAALTIILAI